MSYLGIIIKAGKAGSLPEYQLAQWFSNFSAHRHHREGLLLQHKMRAHPPKLLIQEVRVGPHTWSSNKLSGDADADAAGLEPSFENQ